MTALYCHKTSKVIFPGFNSYIFFSCSTLSSILQTQHHGCQSFQLLCTQTLELSSTTHPSAGLHHTIQITD
ncbi:hypothetical protein LDENG_00176730 [Lucifuga dentata]|nr:hypothetical protein LDENG_00176730 [Lucifuga dentata]